MDAQDKNLSSCEGILSAVTSLRDIFSDPERKYSNRVLDSKLSSIEQLRNDFFGLMNKIVREGKPEQKVKIQSLLTQFDTVCVDAECKIEGFRTTSTETPSKGHGKSCSAKLPKLNLPVFKGGYTEWVGFWNLFENAINSRTDLNPSVKLQYLKSCLDDEPALIVKSLNISDSNYDIAIKKLRSLYYDE